MSYTSMLHHIMLYNVHIHLHNMWTPLYEFYMACWSYTPYQHIPYMSCIALRFLTTLSYIISALSYILSAILLLLLLQRFLTFSRRCILLCNAFLHSLGTQAFTALRLRLSLRRSRIAIALCYYIIIQRTFSIIHVLYIICYSITYILCYYIIIHVRYYTTYMCALRLSRGRGASDHILVIIAISNNSY